MELKQLEMLVAVVEERSVHRAAERVFRTPPAVSIALKKLEEEIGSPLFDRSERHDYLLTQAGEVLYKYAKRVLALRDEAILALDELSHLRRGALRIGAPESISFYVLPALTQSFYQKYPRIKLEVICKQSDKLLLELKDRRIELALLAYPPQDEELEAQLIMRDEVVLITSPQHKLARDKQALVTDLGEEPVIMEDVSSSLHEKVVEAFARFQTPLNIRVESATIEAIKKMVAKNMGVGFVPLMCVREEMARGELVVIKLEDFREERTLWIARRHSDAHSHAAQAFMRIVRTVTSQLLSEPRNLAADDTEPLSEALN